ncbi:MAG: FmdE family protein [Deltaproteobacteria bacterium]|nr:FmdE family protein [Deltaproteobacteria bacterium]
MKTDWLPEFSELVPKLRFIDPLGAFLTGNTDPQPVEYGFTDLVKLSGHSCPTIASAYGMVLEAMTALYTESETPVRGEIRVICPGQPTIGANGPLSQAIGFLTGAATENGFKGLAGKFKRQDLLEFNGDETHKAPFSFIRQDTGKKIQIRFHHDKIPASLQLGELMQKCLSNNASTLEVKEFGRLWQERVRFILVEDNNRKALFEILNGSSR